MSAPDKVREAFEAWVTYKRDLDRLPSGAYAWAQARREWEVWQASRAAALAEARAALEGVDPLECSADWDSGESIACAVQRNAVRVVASLAGTGG